MTSQNFTTAFLVDQTPEEAFAAIVDVRGWWSGEIEGRTDQLGAEFSYRHGDLHYSKQRITELVPRERVVWSVLEASLNFTEEPDEWVGTGMIFEVVRKDQQTEVRFSHVGLAPELECFDQCSSAWGYYINDRLRRSIATATDQPDGVRRQMVSGSSAPRARRSSGRPRS